MNGDRMAKQKFNIILLVDTSRSMQGERIGQVNQAISDISKYLKDMQLENANVDFYISILDFSTEAKWHQGKKEFDINNFKFNEIKACGYSNLHLAYHELHHLDENLSFHPPLTGQPPHKRRSPAPAGCRVPGSAPWTGTVPC